MIPIGDNIRIARTRLGYTQEYVAEELGISKQRYRQLENEGQDALTWGRLLKISKILQIDINTLINFHSNPFSPNKNCASEDAYKTELKDMIESQKELIERFKKIWEQLVLSGIVVERTFPECQ